MGNLGTNALIANVDENDTVVGTLNRRDLPTAHANFRVVHVLLFDDSGRLLLQQIASGNRSAGMWGSSVAGYVLAGEDYYQAACRTVANELGTSLRTPLWAGKFAISDLGGKKFIGIFSAHAPHHLIPNSVDIAALKFAAMDDIQEDMRQRSQAYTPTFREVFRFFREGQERISGH